MRRFTFTRSRWLLLGAVIGAFLAGGAAYAAIPDSNGVINGCYVTNGGQLRVIDPSAGQSCTPGETPISWSQTGPQGPAGPQGPKGDTGATGPSNAYVAPLGGGAVTGTSPMTVASKSVPPGNYVVNADVSLRSPNPGGGPVTCGIFQGDSALALASTFVVVPTGGTESIPLQTTLKPGGPPTVSVQCRGGNPQVDVEVPTAQLSLIQVGAIN